MVKLIMTDIDGTLIPDGTMDINPEYFEVIEKLVEKGIIFVVASGRHMSSVKKVFAPVLDKIWVASQNGNVLTYHGKSRIINSTGVGKRDVETIFKTERSRRCS